MRKRASLIAILFLVAISIFFFHGEVRAADCDGLTGQTVGLFCNDGAYDGYTLFKPLRGVGVYLIDNDGDLLWEWQEPDNYRGVTMILTKDGKLIRNLCKNATRFCGGNGELLRIYDWYGDIIWEHEVPGAHHDVVLMPSGNLLLIVTQDDGSESLMEIKPNFKKGKKKGKYLPGAKIVWEWYVRDHVGLNDPAKFYTPRFRTLNALDYNSERDEILMSFNNSNELIVISHDTTTEEAAGPMGDIKYRWGNPMNYDPGDWPLETSRQHSTKWIKNHEFGYHYKLDEDEGLSNILWFNNGFNRVDEIIPPFNSNGYFFDGIVYGPETTNWSYDFSGVCNAGMQSSVQRFPNGNTLFACSNDMMFVEVTTEGEMVWKYVHPFATYNTLSPVPTGMEEVQRACYEEIPTYLTTSLNYNVDRYAVDFPGFEGKEFYDPGLQLVDLSPCMP